MLIRPALLLWNRQYLLHQFSIDSSGINFSYFLFKRWCLLNLSPLQLHLWKPKNKSKEGRMTKYGSNFINLFIVGETRRFLEFETQLQKQIDMPYSKVVCTMEKLLQRFLKKFTLLKGGFFVIISITCR